MASTDGIREVDEDGVEGSVSLGVLEVEAWGG